MAVAAASIPASNAIYRSGEMLPPNVIYDRLLDQAAAPIADGAGLLSSLANIVNEYVLGSSILGWYTAFTKLYTMKERQAIMLPALPPDILQTLLGPITAKEARAFKVPEGTLVSEVYSLRLVHEGSLNEYEARLQKYRTEHPNDPDAAALKFGYICSAEKDRLETSRNEWGWALVSNSILPYSKSKAYQTQISSLPSNCQLPDFSIVCTSTIDHALATKEKLLKEKEGLWSSIYTRILEPIYLCVGGFSSCGLQVIYGDNSGLPHVGAAVVRVWNKV